jgi:hypothetical protein
MGLGIHSDGIHTVYEIPLNSGHDEKWNDRSWLIEHLRQLADKLEETKFEVYVVGIEMDAQYKTPKLFIKGWEHKEDVLADIIDGGGELFTDWIPEAHISLSQFQGLPDKQKWEIFESLLNIEWTCPECGNVMDKPHTVIQGGLFCSHCDELLTKRTGGGQNNPFNWSFRRINEK